SLTIPAGAGGKIVVAPIGSPESEAFAKQVVAELRSRKEQVTLMAIRDATAAKLGREKPTTKVVIDGKTGNASWSYHSVLNSSGMEGFPVTSESLVGVNMQLPDSSYAELVKADTPAAAASAIQVAARKIERASQHGGQGNTAGDETQRLETGR